MGNFFIITLAVALMLGGLLFSFWPLVPLGIALLVLYGQTAFGITSALVFDVLYGAPLGALAILHFPFLLWALACLCIRIVSLRFVLERGATNAL